MVVYYGQDITAAQYEVLRAKAARVLGEPSGTWSSGSVGTTAGYNQATQAPIKLPSDLITADDWNALRSDIRASYFHIYGELPSLNLVPVGEAITAEKYNDFEAIADINITNRNIVHPTQKSLTTGTVGTLTSSWNGVQQHSFTVTWDNENHKKGWINAGGTLRFSVSGSYAGSDNKSQDWLNIFNTAGIVDINNLSITLTNGVGTIGVSQSGPSYAGWWFLDALPLNTSQTIYTTNGNDDFYSEYNDNYYQIQCFKRSNTQFEFRVICNDIVSAAPDSNVETDVTSTVQVFTASGSYVSLDVPVFSEAASNTFNFA